MEREAVTVMKKLSGRNGLVCAVALAAVMAAPVCVMVAQDAPPQQAEGGNRGRMGRGVSGEAVSVNGSSITIKNERGETWNVITTDNTRMMKNRQPAKTTDIKAGDGVMAMGVPDADKHEVHAAMVIVIDAATVAEQKANLGKTYIVGRVTAIDETKLTIERPDKVSQVIEADESTSFRRGGRSGTGMGAGGNGMGPRGGQGATPQQTEGESITLADIKVGDSVSGTGSLKGTTFVPKQLNVMTRPERRGPSTQPSTPPPTPPSTPPQ